MQNQKEQWRNNEAIDYTVGLFTKPAFDDRPALRGKVILLIRWLKVVCWIYVALLTVAVFSFFSALGVVYYGATVSSGRGSDPTLLTFVIGYALFVSALLYLRNTRCRIEDNRSATPVGAYFFAIYSFVDLLTKLSGFGILSVLFSVFVLCLWVALVRNITRLNSLDKTLYQ